MDWAEEVLDAANSEEEADDGGLMRTRSKTFLDAEQEDYRYTKYVYIDADDTMQGPFYEDQMRGWFSAGYFTFDTKVSTYADGGPQGDWQNAGIAFGASPTRRSSSPPAAPEVARACSVTTPLTPTVSSSHSVRSRACRRRRQSTRGSSRAAWSRQVSTTSSAGPTAKVLGRGV